MKICLGAGLAGLFVVCATSSAFAQDGKLKLGVRLGYALPAGHVYGDIHEGGITISALKLSDEVTDQVPIGVDLGYLVIPKLMLGVYGQYGFSVSTPTNCPDCSAHDLKLGIQAQYHFTPESSVDPWLGAGLGYESLKVSEGGADLTLRGLELLNLQGGVDLRATSALTLGPFVSVSLDEYVRATNQGFGSDIHPKALHEWITLGVKGTYGI